MVATNVVPDGKAACVAATRVDIPVVVGLVPSCLRKIIYPVCVASETGGKVIAVQFNVRLEQDAADNVGCTVGKADSV